MVKAHLGSLERILKDLQIKKATIREHHESRYRRERINAMHDFRSYLKWIRPKKNSDWIHAYQRIQYIKRMFDVTRKEVHLELMYKSGYHHYSLIHNNTVRVAEW